LWVRDIHPDGHPLNAPPWPRRLPFLTINGHLRAPLIVEFPLVPLRFEGGVLTPPIPGQPVYVPDNDALVHIKDAHIYIGWHRSSIYKFINPTNPRYDARFPEPVPNTGSGTYFRRGDLIAFSRLPKLTVSKATTKVVRS
jgi:hypothetical protein